MAAHGKQNAPRDKASAIPFVHECMHCTALGYSVRNVYEHGLRAQTATICNAKDYQTSKTKEKRRRKKTNEICILKFSFLSIKMRPICNNNGKSTNIRDLILIAAAAAAAATAAVSSCNCRSHISGVRSYTRAQFPLFA